MLMLAMLLMSRCEVSLRCPTISGIKEATLGNLMAIFIESNGKYVSCVFVSQKLDSSNAGLGKDQCIQTCREFRLMKKRTEEKFQQFVSYYFIKESLFH